MSWLKHPVAKVFFVFDFMLLLVAFPGAASAYTDPGTGALLWQAIAAGFVGVAFYARRIVRFFRRDTTKTVSQPASSDQ